MLYPCFFLESICISPFIIQSLNAVMTDWLYENSNRMKSKQFRLYSTPIQAQSILDPTSTTSQCQHNPISIWPIYEFNSLRSATVVDKFDQGSSRLLLHSTVLMPIHNGRPTGLNTSNGLSGAGSFRFGCGCGECARTGKGCGSVSSQGVDIPDHRFWDSGDSKGFAWSESGGRPKDGI